MEGGGGGRVGDEVSFSVFSNIQKLSLGSAHKFIGTRMMRLGDLVIRHVGGERNLLAIGFDGWRRVSFSCFCFGLVSFLLRFSFYGFFYDTRNRR